MREMVLAIRAIWDSWQNGTKPSFEGEYYRYTLTSPFFNPGPIEHPNIPIHISAINPYNCRTVGELCDGIKLHGFNTMKYLREVILPNIAKGAKKAGRDPKEIVRSFYGWASLMAEQGLPNPWQSVDAFEDMVGRYREVSVNEFVIDHPPTEQYAVLEKVAADVIPRIRRESAGAA